MELKTDRQQQQQEEEAEEMQQQQKEQHFHVLAVDDSVIDRKLLEKLLKVSSCQVTCVESVDKALEYLGLLNNLDCDSSPPSQQDQGLKVNLIITDFCMPGMSGYDLLKRVKGSSWKDVPVVVMSSENVPSRISMCMEGGAEEFMLKPLQLSDLDKIQAYLLRSPDHSNTNIDKDLIEEEEEDNNKIEEDDSNKNSGSNNNNSNSKRKAISSEAAERIPKMKGVSVPVVV